MAKRSARARLNALPVVSILGAYTLASGDGNTDAGDYRAVPDSDRGEGYGDRGMLGSYTPERDAYSDPAEVKHYAGFGASLSDIGRGYCDPGIREAPAYDLANYKDRSTQPKLPDEDNGNRQSNADDWEFRGRATRSRGFFTRPRIPTER